MNCIQVTARRHKRLRGWRFLVDFLTISLYSEIGGFREMQHLYTIKICEHDSQAHVYDDQQALVDVIKIEYEQFAKKYQRRFFQSVRSQDYVYTLSPARGMGR